MRCALRRAEGVVLLLVSAVLMAGCRSDAPPATDGNTVYYTGKMVKHDKGPGAAAATGSDTQTPLPAKRKGSQY